MSSRMEQIIDEIEEYISNCKPQMLSSTKIIVDREELEELIAELRSKTPEEIKRYQKIISNKEAILADAQTKADAIIAQAQVKTDELVSEHQIMQQAYAQANEVVTLATRQAQEILDSATNDANGVRDAAMRYLDEMLANMENLMTSTLNTTTAHYESFYKAINSFNDVVKANRAEMHPELADLSNPETYDIQDEGEDA